MSSYGLLKININKKEETMQILISGQQITLGDNFRSYAENALETAVSKYFDGAISADIRVTKDGNNIKTELTVNPATGSIVRASALSADAYASLDGAVSRLARQLRKYKNKLVERKNQVVELVDMAVIESDSQEEEAQEAPIIIAEMQTELPICTVSAAVMKMDLEGLPALLFKNTAHGGLNMVYRRADGNIGWVDPKNK